VGKWVGYTAHDPIEDTERLAPSARSQQTLSSYTAHDPIEDTERMHNNLPAFTGNKVTLPTIR